MSRIAGLFGGDAASRGHFLPRMMECLRSKDAWTSATVRAGRTGLGWCGWARTSLASEHGVLVAFDGRIYDRRGLPEAGTDAELVALLYRRYGLPAALRRLNADFALAVYDPGADTIWLARDRFGVRPMYYVETTAGLAFASRPRALFPLPGVSRRPRREFVALFAASHYRYFDNDPGASPYADIRQLPAAHVLQATPDGVAITCYWSLEEAPDLDGPEHVIAEQCRDLLLDAVALRLATAARPAFTLSGGLDSSSILACAVRATGVRYAAFSAVYEDERYDERNEIRPMVEAVGARWHPVAVDDPDVFATVARMIDAHDEPVATATWLSHFVLSEHAARQGFDVVFGGLGGDELNAGEYEHFIYHFADLRAAGLASELASEIDLWVRHHDHPVFRKSGELAYASIASLTDPGRPGRCLPDRGRILRYARALDPEFFRLDGFEPVMDHPYTSYLKSRTYQDIARETVPCCLRALDRDSIAFGLESLQPFFDHRLVEFMFRVPGRMKIRDGVTKHLLREAMRGLLPEETRTRVRKVGWNAPAHRWFAGAGHDLLMDLVRSRAFRERGIYDLAEVERIIHDHERIVATEAREPDHMMFLWQLVNLELWLAALAAPPTCR